MAKSDQNIYVIRDTITKMDMKPFVAPEHVAKEQLLITSYGQGRPTFSLFQIGFIADDELGETENGLTVVRSNREYVCSAKPMFDELMTLQSEAENEVTPDA